MPRKRSPGDDKRLDYEKQQRGFSEYKHSLRHGKWRKGKRRPAQQKERQAERRAVSAASPVELSDPGFDPGAIVRPKVRKWAPVPLGEWVEQQTKKRSGRAGGKQRRRKAQKGR
jgi:hypothetical protein